MTTKREIHRIVVPTDSRWLEKREGARELDSLWKDGGEGEEDTSHIVEPGHQITIVREEEGEQNDTQTS